MNSPQKEAAKIIKLAYKNGGSINLSVLKFTHNKDKIASEVTHILSAYGYMTSNTVDSNFGWEIYKLSEKGMELAKKGVFNENPENILSTRYIALFALAAFIITFIIISAIS